MDKKEKKEENKEIKKAIAKIEKILNKRNLMLVPVTTLVGGRVYQRVDLQAKPEQPQIPPTAEEIAKKSK